MTSSVRPVGIALTLLLASMPVLRGATVPVAVSPGSPDAAVPVDTSCPTFSWGALPDAVAYEIVAYEIGRRGEMQRIGRPAIRETVPGSASSWTPSSDQALTRGASYAWAVRAIRTADRSPWSLPSLFRVAQEPSPAELQQLLEILQQSSIDSAGRLEPAATATVAADASSDTKTNRASAPAASTSALGGADFSIDQSGNVLGTSFGGDGSGLTNLDWAALVNVPPDFADGVDAVGPTYAAGNQLDLNATTFDVVEGSGSDLDADLLDGQHMAYFAPQAETYTKTQVDALLTLDNISAPTPGKPTNLRVGPEHRFPGMRRLSWNIDSLAGVASFTVYQADYPIDDANKSVTLRRVTSSLYAPVELYPGSGIQHFRVEAVNVLGESGPLSDEFTIDTTSRLAYLADQRADGLLELFTVPATGSGATRVSDDLITFGNVFAFAWSPDGSRLAYTADQDTDEKFEIYVVSASGGGAVKVNDPLAADRDVSTFAWSPDGSQLAYRADQDTNEKLELYVVPTTGGGAVKVNDSLATNRDVWNFAWSPDGSRLAYIADQDTDEIRELYVVPATGGSAVKVNDSLVADRDVMGFAWSPDGSRLAYRADQNTDEIYELFVGSATGGGAIKVNDPLIANGDLAYFAWSPDGSRLAYIADQFVDEKKELFVVPATGGGATRVSDDFPDDKDVWEFAWSPSGIHLSHRGSQDVNSFELFVVPATGGGAVKVNDPLVTNGAVIFFPWSPDGSRLAYSADQETDEIRELYVVPASGGGAVKVSDTLTGDADVISFDWSPDGSRVGYLADPVTDDVFELYVAAASGAGANKVSDALVANGSISDFSWSPLGVD